jgi:hypothetical protein
MRASSPVAQLVEQAAVNRWVAGSNPARGARETKHLAILVQPQNTAWVRNGCGTRLPCPRNRPSTAIASRRAPEGPPAVEGRPAPRLADVAEATTATARRARARELRSRTRVACGIEKNEPTMNDPDEKRDDKKLTVEGAKAAAEAGAFQADAFSDGSQGGAAKAAAAREEQASYPTASPPPHGSSAIVTPEPETSPPSPVTNSGFDNPPQRKPWVPPDTGMGRDADWMTYAAAEEERRVRLGSAVQARADLSLSDPKASAPAANTQIGRAVLENRIQIVLNLEVLQLLINDKLAALRAERLNTDEANQQIEHFEKLKASVEAFHRTSLEFSAGRTGEDAVVTSTISFADGLKNWWTKSHVQICDRAFDFALFTLGVGVCLVAGAPGGVAAAVSGAVVKGKPVADAIKAAMSKKGD